MTKIGIKRIVGIALISVLVHSCVPKVMEKSVSHKAPESYNGLQDSTNSATIKWKDYFNDPYLTALIDTALANNQELNIILQEINISQNEVMARKGEYLPFLNLGAGGGIDKVGRFTRDGALEATTDIEPGKEFPEPFSDLEFGAYANWEIDVWKRLRNAKKAAVMRYLASVEGKNFMVTNLIAEIANSYFELLALDSQLEIIEQNIELQTNALRIVRLQKNSAKVTELAVRRFEAQLLDTRSLQFGIKQQITETENRINFLVGRFPQPVERSKSEFVNMNPQSVYAGLPSQLLENRPDIRQAEQMLEAAKLDVKVAKANFYPRLDLSAAVGLQAFNPAHFIAPESILYNVAGDVVAPLINRNAIKATYQSANAQQVQAVYHYEQTVLNAYIEVVNQISNINNLEQSFELKQQQVQTLTKSVDISNDLFRSARADYMEVLMTQREALESKFELVETKRAQLGAMVHVYQALGGGWN